MLRMSNIEFDLWVERTLPQKLNYIFPRDDDGIWPIKVDIDLREYYAFQTSLLAIIPVVGSAIGLAKLFSVWAAYSKEDSWKSVVYYTTLGILELLGLGIFVFILKICYLCIKIIQENIQKFYRSFLISFYREKEVIRG
ncbi:hypothetical protein [Chlamydia avium]|nr:hypothetical protein [Chlamydia avium]